MATNRSPGDLFQSFISSLYELTSASVQSVNRGLDTVINRVKESFEYSSPNRNMYTQERLKDISTPTATLLDFDRAVEKTIEALKNFTSGARQAFNAMYDDLKPSGQYVEPTYVYKYGFLNEQLQMRKGLWEALKSSPSEEFMSKSMQYYMPEAKAAEILRTAAERFEDVFDKILSKGQDLSTRRLSAFEKEFLREPYVPFAVSPSIVKTLQTVMNQTYAPLKAFHDTTGEITRLQLNRYASTTLLSQLKDVGPTFRLNQIQSVVDEIDRSFADAITPKMQQLTQTARSYLNQYLETFQTIGMVPGMPASTNASKTLFTAPRRVITYEQMGELGVEIGSSLEKLERLRTLPNLQDEVKRYVLGTVRAQLTGTAVELAKTPAASEELKQSLSRAVSQFGVYESEYERYKRLSKVTTTKSEELTTLETLKSAIESGNIETYKNTLSKLREEGKTTIKEYDTTTGKVKRTVPIEELLSEPAQKLFREGWNPSSLSAGAERTTLITELDTVIQRLQSELEGLTESFAKAKNNSLNLEKDLTNKLKDVTAQIGTADLSKLTPEERLRFKTIQEEANKVLSKLPVFLGEQPPSLMEKFSARYLRPLSGASAEFVGMNVRSFEMALMFGFSSSVFEALTRMPMESTYQTIQPVFHTLGGLTGVTPFWQEFQQFASQAPAVMSDLQSRLNTIHALLGSQAAASQAVTRAIDISRVQPIQFPEAMEVLTALSVYPSTRVKAANPQFQEDVFTAVQLLSMLAPEQGIGGALFAIREMLGGQFRSLQMRFNIGPETLAAFAGKTVSEFKGAPGAEKLEILTKALENMFGGQEVLFRKGAQFDVQLRNISDTLVQAIVLPMVTNTQQAFVDTINRLFTTTVTRSGKTEQMKTPVTTIAALKETSFMQLIPEAQQKMLIGLSEQRAYYQLTPEQQQIVESAYREAYPKAKTPTADDLVKFLLSEGKSNPQLEKIYQQLQQYTVQNAKVIAGQTYGSLSGFLGLIVTAFNNALPAIVKSFGIASGITNLVSPFAQRAITRTQQVTAQLQYSTTDAERQQIAKEYLQGLAQDFQASIQDLRAKLNTSDIQHIFRPIIDTIRELSMVTFSPVVEAMIVQTAKTALALPSQFIGGTIESFVRPTTMPQQKASFLDVLQSSANLATWGSMFLMGQFGVWPTLRAGVGAALIGRAAANVESNGPNTLSLAETLAGMGLLYAARKDTFQNLILKSAITFESASKRFESFIGKERLASVEAGLSRIAPIRFLAGEKLGIVKGAMDVTAHGVLPWLSAGIGLYEMAKAPTSPHPTAQAISGGLGLLGGLMFALSPAAPMLGGVGLALMGLQMLIPVLTSLSDMQTRKQQQEIQYKQEVESIRRGMNTPIQEREQYARQQLAQLSTAYHVPRYYVSYNEGRQQIVDTTKFESMYIKYLSFIPRNITEFAVSALYTPAFQAQQKQEIVYTGIQGYIQRLILKGLEGVDEKQVNQVKVKQLQTIGTFNATISAEVDQFVQQMRRKGGMTPEQESAWKSRVTQEAIKMFEQISGGKVPYKELEKAAKAFADVLESKAKEIGESLSNLKEQIQPAYKSIFGKQIVTKALEKEVYLGGLPEPHPVKFTIGAQQQTAQQTIELASGAMKMLNVLGQQGSSVIDRAIQLGILSPNEAFGAKTALYATAGQLIATGKMPVSQAITRPWFGEMLSWLQFSAPKLYEQVKEKTRASLLTETGLKVERGQKFVEDLDKLPGLNVNIQGLSANFSKLGQTALSTASNLEKLSQSLQQISINLHPEKTRVKQPTAEIEQKQITTRAETAKATETKETPTTTNVFDSYIKKALQQSHPSKEKEPAVVVKNTEGFLNKLTGGVREVIPLKDIQAPYYQNLLKSGNLQVIGLHTGEKGAYGLPPHTFVKLEQLPDKLKNELVSGKVPPPTQQFSELPATKPTETKPIEQPTKPAATVPETKTLEEKPTVKPSPKPEEQLTTKHISYNLEKSVEKPAVSLVKRETPEKQQVTTLENLSRACAVCVNCGNGNYEKATQQPLTKPAIYIKQQQENEKPEKQLTVPQHIAALGSQPTVVNKLVESIQKQTIGHTTQPRLHITQQEGKVEVTQPQTDLFSQLRTTQPSGQISMTPTTNERVDVFTGMINSISRSMQRTSQHEIRVPQVAPTRIHEEGGVFTNISNLLSKPLTSPAPQIKIPELSQTKAAGFTSFKPLANEPRQPLWNPSDFRDKVGSAVGDILHVKTIKADNAMLS